MFNLPEKWTSAKTKAIELLVDEPGKSHQDIGDEVGVSRMTIHRWRKDPEFVEILYQKYMISFLHNKSIISISHKKYIISFPYRKYIISLPHKKYIIKQTVTVDLVGYRAGGGN